MKYFKILAVIMSFLLLLTSCGELQGGTAPQNETTKIELGDEEIKVNGKTASTSDKSAVYVANDIIYYESGKDFTYGEGTEKDAHTKDEAAAHIVVHIREAGTYNISGKLSLGQIAIDLGKEAKENPEAVVTLVLNGMDITCKVAPAVIFYNVYECGNDDTEKASKDVDTSKAGANVIIAEGTENIVNGSYVERIYEPESVILNDDKTEVEDAEKLHKYDGAFYSKRSMNISGTGILNINAENEGLDSELHLTINGGIINITSGNDGINTNEDEVSVTTINGGELTINVTGETGEGDGIDSNGWLVINGGKVIAAACSDSADAGIDSDMGIHIKGGTVIATGSMLDRIEDDSQNHAVFNFAQKQDGKTKITMKNKNGKALFEHIPQNKYSVMIYSSPDLTEGAYTLWDGDNQLAVGVGDMMMGGQQKPSMKPEGDFAEGRVPPERPKDFERPEGEKPSDQREPPEGVEPPKNSEFPERPNGQNGDILNPQELTTEFKVVNGANMFSSISYSE